MAIGLTPFRQARFETHHFVLNQLTITLFNPGKAKQIRVAEMKDQLFIKNGGFRRAIT
jgi:hypothetical protein